MLTIEGPHGVPVPSSDLTDVWSQEKRLRQLEYTTVPTGYMSKVPFLDEWQKKLITDDTAKLLMPTPVMGLGVRNDSAPALDVDCLVDDALADRLKVIAKRHFPDRLVRVGHPPSFVLFFRPDPTLESFKRTYFRRDSNGEATGKMEMDFRAGAGQYTKVWGGHPATGEMYDYPGRTLFEVAANDLPAVTMDALAAFFDEAEEAVLAAGFERKATRKERAGAAAGGAGEPLREGERDMVLKALREGHNALHDRQDWVTLCLALITIFGDDDLEMREAWVAWSDRYEGEVTEGEAERVWDTTLEVSGTLTMASVVGLLQQAGVGKDLLAATPPPAVMPSNEEVNDGYDPRAAMAEQKEQRLKNLPDAHRLKARAEPPAPPRMVIESMMPLDINVLIGPGDIGKTTMAIAFAHAIILGGQIAGHQVLEPGPVLLFTKEDSYDLIDYRRWHMLDQEDYTDEEREKLQEQFIVVSPQEQGTSDHESRIVATQAGGTIEETAYVADMEEYIRRHKPKLVIVDPMNQWAAGERFMNDNEAALISALRGLVIRHGVAILLIHHTGQDSTKRKERTATAGRGGTSGAWNARMVAVAYPVDTVKEAQDLGAPPEARDPALIAERCVTSMTITRVAWVKKPRHHIFMVRGVNKPWKFDFYRSVRDTAVEEQTPEQLSKHEDAVMDEALKAVKHIIERDQKAARKRDKKGPLPPAPGKTELRANAVFLAAVKNAGGKVGKEYVAALVERMIGKGLLVTQKAAVSKRMCLAPADWPMTDGIPSVRQDTPKQSEKLAESGDTEGEPPNLPLGVSFSAPSPDW